MRPTSAHLTAAPGRGSQCAAASPHPPSAHDNKQQGRSAHLRSSPHHDVECSNSVRTLAATWQPLRQTNQCIQPSPCASSLTHCLVLLFRLTRRCALPLPEPLLRLAVLAPRLSRLVLLGEVAPSPALQLMPWRHMYTECGCVPRGRAGRDAHRGSRILSATLQICPGRHHASHAPRCLQSPSLHLFLPCAARQRMVAPCAWRRRHCRPLQPSAVPPGAALQGLRCCRPVPAAAAAAWRQLLRGCLNHCLASAAAAGPAPSCWPAAAWLCLLPGAPRRPPAAAPAGEGLWTTDWLARPQP